MEQEMQVWEDSEQLVSDGQEIWLKCKTRQSQGLIHVDYLSFSARAEKNDDFEVASLAHQLAERLSNLKDGLVVEEGKGVHFFEKSLKLKAGECLQAVVLFGGCHQKGVVHVQLPGAFWIDSTTELNQEVYDLLTHFHVSQLSRIDLARDCFNGESSFQDMQNAYHDGKFKPSRGVTPSLWTIQDERRGSTCHIGRRENGKLIRGYEKSMQLARQQGWFRVELELRSVNRKIPLDAVLDPAAYFSGACQYLSSLCDSCREERVKTFQKTAELSLDHCAHYARVCYGPLLKFFNDAGFEAHQIFERLTSGVTKLPRRLSFADPREIFKVMGCEPSLTQSNLAH